MSTTVFGISNCDTVKKARRWFEEQNIDYQFHDFRKDGLTPAMVEQWLDHCAWDQLVNKRSTTWRQLDQDTKDGLGRDNVVALLTAHPTLIKRPVIRTDNSLLLGFNPEQVNALFS